MKKIIQILDYTCFSMIIFWHLFQAYFYSQIASVPPLGFITGLFAGTVLTPYNLYLWVKNRQMKEVLFLFIYIVIIICILIGNQILKGKEEEKEILLRKKNTTLEYIKNLSKEDFPKITALDEDEVLLMIDSILKSNHEISLKKSLLIYEDILNQE